MPNWAEIAAVILDKAPYLMAALVGLGMAILGSIGRIGKAEIDQQTRHNLKRFGWFVFWVFLVIYGLEISGVGARNLLNSILHFILLPIAELIFGVVGLLYFGVRYLGRVVVEKGYKSSGSPPALPDVIVSLDGHVTVLWGGSQASH